MPKIRMNPKSKMSLKNKPEKIPSQSKDAPATQGMLFEFRSEVNERFNAQDHKFEALGKNIESRFQEVKSEISEIKSMFHQAMLRFEAQEANNKVIFEGWKTLSERQDRIEEDVREVKSTVKELARVKSSSV